MGTPNYIYIGYGMVFQYQIVILFYIISIYTVCHVDHYVKVHQVQIKFWLITANSASDHSFRKPAVCFGHDMQFNRIKNRSTM